MEDTWLNRNRQTISIVSVAVAMLALGFTIGIRFGDGWGQKAAARSQAVAERATKQTEDCIGALKRAVAQAPAGNGPEDKPQNP